MSFGTFSTKGMRFAPEVLSSKEVRGLMDGCSRRWPTGMRDRALIAVMYRGGLRVNEALMLSVGDVDLATGVVRVLHAKGGKTRSVAVDPETIALVELWLSKRRELGISSSAPLFCTLKGTKVSRVHVTQRFKQLAEKAGIGKRVHPHALRHSRAVDLLRAGADVVVISRALGHANVATTNTYLQHLTPDAVLDAMRGGTW